LLIKLDPRLELAATIIESSDDAIISRSLDGTITSWNPSAERLFGYRADEIVARSILTIIPPELHDEEAMILRRLCAGERIEHYETERMHKDGHRVPVSVAISLISDANGKAIGASEIARDVSGRRQKDEARFRLAAIVESSDDAIVGKDLNGIINSWNGGAERLFGYTESEIIGKSVLTLIPEHLQYEEPEILRRLTSNQRIDHYETQRITKSGQLVDVSLTISPVRDSRGRVIGASKVARDISERKRAQSILLESEKMAATGRMAATLAHEINNPLESLTNLAYLLANHPSLDAQARKYAQMMDAEISRTCHITRETLAFYRHNSTPSEVFVSELIENLLSLLEPRFTQRKVRLICDLEQSASVWGIASELKQVFMNLLLNAADAFDGNGEIRIRVRASTSGVHVSVSDNGFGIPEDIRRQIFEPFFSTKRNKGTGLGLWVSKGIIAKHQGQIRVRSKISGLHRGTLFTVVLPRSATLKDEATAA